MLDGLSAGDQERFLLYTMEDLDSLSGELDRLLVSWQRGDAAAVEAVLNESTAGRPDLAGMLRSFIDERNERMLRKMVGYLEGDGRYFVVVGAGHLVGENGLIARLGQKGYEVRQM